MCNSMLSKNVASRRSFTCGFTLHGRSHFPVESMLTQLSYTQASQADSQSTGGLGNGFPSSVPAGELDGWSHCNMFGGTKGSSLGIEDGVAVGLSEGVMLGTALGTAVGDEEGAELGTNDGCEVG
jgi:hypothetical protein